MAEWLPHPPVNLRAVGSILVSATYFRRPLAKTSSVKYASEHRRRMLLGGRVVSVVTIPVMVSRRGSRFKSVIKKPWAASQNRDDPWNLVGWVTPR